MFLASAFLVWSELARWWRGAEHHTFAVEKGVGQDMQINLDVVVRMRCGDLHVNVQDASGDLILAGMLLKKEDTAWSQWADRKGTHRLGRDEQGRGEDGGGVPGGVRGGGGVREEHVHDIVAAGGRRGRSGARRQRSRGRRTAVGSRDERPRARSRAHPRLLRSGVRGARIPGSSISAMLLLSKLRLTGARAFSSCSRSTSRPTTPMRARMHWPHR